MSALAAQECHEGNMDFFLCQTYDDIMCGFILVVLKWLLYLQASNCPPKQEERDGPNLVYGEGKPFPWDFHLQPIERCKVNRIGFETVRLPANSYCHNSFAYFGNLIFILSQNVFGNSDLEILSYLKLISEISHKAEVQTLYSSVPRSICLQSLCIVYWKYLKKL